MSAPLSEGTVPFVFNGEEFHTYYKAYGPLTNPTKPPLVLVHGGPGFTHDYLGPMADIAHQNPGQTVIFYDQLGNGGSSRLTEKPVEWFSVKMYVDELANLVDRLGLEAFHLFGHSWGGPLVAEFAVEVAHPGLRSVVITNSLAEMSLVSRSFGECIETLDNLEEVKAGFAARWDNPKAYRASLTALYQRYALKYVKELPKELRVLDVVFGDEETGKGGDPTVQQRMICTRTWSIIDRLHRVRVPTLLITGKDDMLKTYCSEPFFWKIEKIKWVNFEESSHVPFWEEREKYMDVVGKWLTSVEESEKK